MFGGVKTAGGGTTDAFAIISKLAAAISAGGDISGAVAEATDGIARGADPGRRSVRGSVGARSARLDLVSDQLTDTAANREIDRSALEDTDVTDGDHRASEDHDDPVGDPGELHQAQPAVAVRLSAMILGRLVTG